MSKGIEIERKFLVDLPDTDKLNVVRSAGILQTYLVNGENGSQRRVRRISENGNVYYTYTEKLFITHVTRRENEYDISEQEYNHLLVQAREDRVPIQKKRFCFNYKEQFFELDIYPFSDKLAILELELDSPEQCIDFPAEINVIAEVSDDERYSNAALAMAGSFPVEVQKKIGDQT